MAKASKKASGKTSKSSSKSSSKGGSRASKSSSKRRSGGQANPAFMAPLTPSDRLAEVVGNKPLPRTEMVKKVWEHIKRNNLQDKKNRRMINADDKLRPLFGRDQISMFDLAKVINKNVK
ncbi:MAG: hypothetical protein ICV66_07150 [Chitinophagaceae bacterium]|nr:hypothetical protein [Chitinophagaceae bacterium]